MGLDLFFYRTKAEEIGYFRKVNFLVHFFESLDYEIDNCVPITITKEDTEELLKRCDEVLKDHSKAEELLPTTSGYFFGNTTYNELYFNDVKSVKEYVKNILLPQFENLSLDEKIEFKIWY